MEETAFRDVWFLVVLLQLCISAFDMFGFNDLAGGNHIRFGGKGLGFGDSLEDNPPVTLNPGETYS